MRHIARMFEAFAAVCMVLGALLILTPPGWLIIVLIWMACVR